MTTEPTSTLRGPASEPRWGASARRAATPDAAAAAAAAARQAVLTKPTGALGRLEDASIWLAGVTGACPPSVPRPAALVVFAGDHGVARSAGTSAYPPEVTAQMVINLVTGGAAASVLARHLGVSLSVVDVAVDVDWRTLGADLPATVTGHRIRRGSGSIDREPALTTGECIAALDLGAALLDAQVDAGAVLVLPGDMGIGNTTPATALIATLTGGDVAALVGRGTGVDDATLARKRAAVTAAVGRAAASGDDPVALLAICGGADIAAMTGFIARAAERGVPVVLDGIVSLAAALVADRLVVGAPAWWAAGHRSTEPAASAALTRLGLEPLLDLGLRLGEGTGALLALPLLDQAAVLLAQMATFADAGVADRPDR